MKLKAGIVFVSLAALCLLGIAAAAQHPQHHPPAKASQAKPKGEMMGKGMMSRHQEMKQLVDQLLQSLSALEGEEDPAALKKKLVEHRALLEELQGKLKQCSQMMQNMMEHMKTMQKMMGAQEAAPPRAY